MKKLIFGLLILAAAACQQSAKPMMPATIDASTMAVSEQEQKVIPLKDSADSLTPAMMNLLKQFDLSPLWAADTAYADGYPLLTGFFGADHYSIALIIDHAERDVIKPNVFRVRGRTRLRKAITPFEGIITVQQIMDFDSCDVQAPEEDSARVYTAKASFTLRQVPNGKKHGTFSGEAFLDFYVTNKGYYRAPEVIMGGMMNRNTPTMGSGRLLRGNWIDAAGEKKPLLVAADLFVIAPEIYSDFGVGDRGTQVNPKYAKLGWADYWENDEWWAESPKPSLNL